jgi:hypothetical protein
MMALSIRARLIRRLCQKSAVIPRQTCFASSVANSNLDTNEQQKSNVPHFTFSEEPLGVPASDGYGYFQGGPGLTLGPENRFKLQAKLGFGTTSSVWLARDRMYDYLSPR